MSQKEPKHPYVYQPDPAGKNPRIYAVGGPGSYMFSECRFTKLEAEALVTLIKLASRHLENNTP